MDMIATPFTGFFIVKKLLCRKDVLPTELAAGTGILAAESVGKRNLAETACQILFMGEFDFGEMVLEFPSYFSRQESGSVASSFGVPDDDLTGGEIEIFDPQVHTFTQAQPTTIKQLDH